MTNYFQLIREWAEDRNLIKGSTQAAQAEKFLEECGELVRAMIEDDDAKFQDAVGDCIVVLTNLAHQRGMLVEDCISSAYNEIKDRKGRMIDGIFIKEEDLPKEPAPAASGSHRNKRAVGSRK